MFFFLDFDIRDDPWNVWKTKINMDLVILSSLHFAFIPLDLRNDPSANGISTEVSLAHVSVLSRSQCVDVIR